MHRQPQPLNPDILEEILFIAREALTNSFRHSVARRIVFSIDHGMRRFTMECRDNGQGFGADQVREAQLKGHWGLRGMAERADKIGAKFSNESTPGNGTRIRLVLPASRAYVRVHSFHHAFRFRRAINGARRHREADDGSLV
jgi:signal transduction histidine kinase